MTDHLPSRILRLAFAAGALCLMLGACSKSAESDHSDDAHGDHEHGEATAAADVEADDDHTDHTDHAPAMAPAAKVATGVRLVSQSDALALTKDSTGVVFLDVRSPGEFQSSHVPGAINIPVGELASRLDELEASRMDEIIVYCEMGGRARKAEDMLGDAGFAKIGHLEGDMGAWRSAGLVTE